MATQPWERQSGETTKAWEAFRTFRDMPPADRSVLGAYKLSTDETEKARKGAIKTVPNAWRDWAFDHDWKQRVAAYDRDQERRRRQERDKIHDAEMKKFRADLQAECALYKQGAKILFAKSMEALQGMKEKETIKIGDVPAFMNSASRMIQATNETLFVGLGLDELLVTLEDTPVSDRPDEEPEEE